MHAFVSTYMDQRYDDPILVRVQLWHAALTLADVRVHHVLSSKRREAGHGIAGLMHY